MATLLLGLIACILLFGHLGLVVFRLDNDLYFADLFHEDDR
jgi:hypothetical protein